METLTNKRQHPGDKQTLANQRLRRSDSPPAACWLIVSSEGSSASDASVADAKTRAASSTSSGKPFSVSLGVAAPPACCSLHLHWLGGHGKHSSKSEAEDYIRVIAGHDDALLIQMRVPHLNPTTRSKLDYYFYEAGGAARRPPLLSLLPDCNIPMQFNHIDPTTPRFRRLSMENTGILRRCGDLVLVCQLEMTWDPPIYDTAELCMLRIGGRQWINRRLPIVEGSTGSSSSSKLQPWRRRHFIPHAAVPVGNRFLCWVDYNSGFILCDMSMAEEEETPKLLRYVPLPPVMPCHDCGYCWPHGCTTIGAAGPEAVRFVSVSPHPHGCSNVITTWTMTLSTEEATAWVKADDVVLDCDEIIRNDPNHGCGLPRDKHLLGYPMVSSDDPDVIYFKEGPMAAAINTRTKELLSVVPSGTGDLHEQDEPPRFMTAKLRW